jgi:putative ABC transport system permease protein
VLGLLGANLGRSLGRTAVMACATALGVATIVALLGVTAGLKQSAGALVHLGRADMGLFQKDAADPTTSVLPDRLGRTLERRPDVARAIPLQLLVERVASDPAAIVFGVPQDSFVNGRALIVEGHRLQSPHEAIVGDHFAKTHHLRPGGTLKLKGGSFPVAGIFHSGIVFEDTGVILPLKAAQQLSGHVGEVTTIAVQLAPGAKAGPSQKAIERDFPSLRAITDAEEAARVGANGQLISKAVFVIAVLALIIGAVAVTNAMLMAVLERRAEFALLSAVGWSAPQVAGLVIAEGIAVAIIGSGVGLLLGVFGARLLVHALGASAFVTPHVEAWGLGRGLIVGFATGFVGGLYPAWRAARLPPVADLARR